jgi:hypothetical protein
MIVAKRFTAWVPLVNIPGNKSPGCPHLVPSGQQKRNPQNLADNQNLRIVSFPGCSISRYAEQATVLPAAKALFEP